MRASLGSRSSARPIAVCKSGCGCSSSFRTKSSLCSDTSIVCTRAASRETWKALCRPTWKPSRSKRSRFRDARSHDRNGIASEGAYDPLFAIEQGVDGEVDADHGADLFDILPRRIRFIFA